MCDNVLYHTLAEPGMGPENQPSSQYAPPHKDGSEGEKKLIRPNNTEVSAMHHT